MPCVLEDAAGEREYRGLVEGRPHDFQLSLALERPDRRRGIERGDVLAGGHAARDRKMALDEVRLARHVLVQPAPAVLLCDQVKEIVRGIVIGRIDSDYLSRKHRLQQILPSFPSLLPPPLAAPVTPTA